ncbi:MAG: alpha-methylacyl-CoA racemase [Bradyrhizobium sp.]|jgi:alpha-methylacyl-CoA racemase|nr:alpha-methylacyl-CoA racemase [Bradyrhizobium sp.]
MGPLNDLRVVEMAGIGPAPFCAMLLADMGAEVIRIDRTARGDLGLNLGSDPRFDVLRRGRKSIALDLKKPEAVAAAKKLIAQADVLVEGFRPGTMERLGLGPEECLAANPKLVYGRMTGFGQEGPEAARAGHDINYIALSGVLSTIGRKDTSPVPPLNLVGDFGGGAMFLAFGIVTALFECGRSGKGQVVDAAMVDGAAYLSTAIHGMKALGLWQEERGTNILDSGAPWYDTYATSDGKYIAIGPVEQRFFQELLSRLQIDAATFPEQFDRARWPEMRERLAEIFKSKTRDQWCEVMTGSDACFAPVLTLGEAPLHPHNRARDTFIDIAGVIQPAPAPRFSRSKTTIPHAPPVIGANADEVLNGWGFAPQDITALRKSGAFS